MDNKQKAMEMLKEIVDMNKNNCPPSIDRYAACDCPEIARQALAALESEPRSLIKARGIIDGMATVLENDTNLTNEKLLRVAGQLRKAKNLLSEPAVSPSELVKQIETEHPLDLEYETDARYIWPKRWKKAKAIIDSQAVTIKSQENDIKYKSETIRCYRNQNIKQFNEIGDLKKALEE